MMRENSRVRSSDSYGQERRSDFRGNLHSIFVDNLDQNVDVQCLWGVFKCFGRVRDIYLPAANKTRKIGFAFVRFATLEEANRVAEKTSGMHIYGWPIKVSVAQQGWNSRKAVGSRAGEGSKDRGERAI